MKTSPSRVLAALLALYLALGALYAVTTPLFEAGDEIWHYPFVQYLATTGKLPVQDPRQRGLWEQEGGQPPLYYALAAAATYWVDTSDLYDRLWLNPQAQIGVPLAFGNKNLIVHTSAEAFPWQGTTLAVHLIRFLSLLFGALTVACTYWTAREILLHDSPSSERRRSLMPLLAAALVAFNPMFLFIMGSVNNDSLAAALTALSLLWMVQLVTRGPTLRRMALLGLSLGLGALTKQSTLGAGLVFGLVLLYLLARAWRMREWQRVRGILLGGLVAGALVAAIAGWWYVRNWVLYGDVTGFNVWLQIAGPRTTPVSLAGLLSEFQGFRISFWGNFGGVNLIAPEWVYALLDLFTLLVSVGLVLGLLKRTLPALVTLPALLALVVFGALVRWTLMTYASQGRLMFPAISAIAILLAVGLEQWEPRPGPPFRKGRETESYLNPPLVRPAARILNPGTGKNILAAGSPWLLRMFAAALFAFALAAPFLIIRPAYALPPRVAVDAPVPNPVHIRFGEKAELVGYALSQRDVRPGGSLPLTLYWRALAPLDEDYTLYIHLFDARGNSVGQWDAFPGNGLYPTRLWREGEILVDSYRVPVAWNASAPQGGRIEVGLYRRKGLANLPAFDPNGNVITPVLARFKIAAPTSASAQPMQARFGDLFGLVRASIETTDTIHLSVTWQTLQAPGRDYTLFVQLLDASGQIVGQGDRQPQDNAFPTSWWAQGDVVEDWYDVPRPAQRNSGPYRLVFGWYDAAGRTRLPLDRGGDAFVIEDVRVR